MKIKKGRLKQIIKEELDIMEQEDSDTNLGIDEELAQEVANIATNEPEIYEAFRKGEIDLKGVSEAAMHAYLEYKAAHLKDALFLDEQIEYLDNLLSQTPTYGIEEGCDECDEMEESAQSGGSEKRGSDPYRELGGKYSMRGEKAGRKKQIKKAASRSERRAGKKETEKRREED